MNRLIPAGFDVRLSGRTVILEIRDIEGTEYMVPMTPDYADELGRQLLAAVIATGGKLA